MREVSLGLDPWFTSIDPPSTINRVGKGSGEGWFEASSWIAPVLQNGMLLTDRWVVKRDISHAPLPPKQVARLAMYVQWLVYGFTWRLTQASS